MHGRNNKKQPQYVGPVCRYIESMKIFSWQDVSVITNDFRPSESVCLWYRIWRALWAVPVTLEQVDITSFQLLLSFTDKLLLKHKWERQHALYMLSIKELKKLLGDRERLQHPEKKWVLLSLLQNREVSYWIWCPRYLKVESISTSLLWITLRYISHHCGDYFAV